MKRLCLTIAVALVGGMVSAQTDLQVLVDQLAGDDAGLRAQAYNELIRRRVPELVPLLAKKITAMPLGGQQLAIYLLQQQPLEVTRTLYEKLVDAERPLLRAAAAAVLIRNGDKSKVPLLAKAIAAASEAERSGVLNATWSVDDARVQDAIRAYLRADANAGIIVSALQHLRQAEKGHSAVTDQATQALTAASDLAVRAAALAWLAGGEGNAHATALAALLRAEPDRFWPIQNLLDRDKKFSLVLVEAIAEAVSKPRSKHEIAQAAPLLLAQSPELAQTTLRKLLTHQDKDIRASALEALATMRGGLEGNALRQLLQDPDPQQQLVAAATLRRMDDASGLPVVLALVRTAGPHKAQAARVLAGFRHRDVVLPLLDCLDDANVQVRQNAWQGLQTQLRDLFPYRRYDFTKSGYEPNAASRADGIAALRSYWASIQ